MGKRHKQTFHIKVNRGIQIIYKHIKMLNLISEQKKMLTKTIGRYYFLLAGWQKLKERQ